MMGPSSYTIPRAPGTYSIHRAVSLVEIFYTPWTRDSIAYEGLMPTKLATLDDRIPLLVLSARIFL